MSVHTAEIFLGRQPILDRQRHVVAYELLFRSGPGNEARVTNPAQATARVVSTFRQLGIPTVLGKRNAFINVDAATLLSRAVEALPHERVVLELLETIEITPAIVHRCRALKAQGYRLALDDVLRYGEEDEPLLELVDIVKVDVLPLNYFDLVTLVDRLKSWPPKLLAEKVDTVERANTCRSLGFQLFQGFWFGQPTMLAA